MCGRTGYSGGGSELTDEQLIDNLVHAAKAAIMNERLGLIYDRSRLKGITLDLTVANNGAVVTG